MKSYVKDDIDILQYLPKEVTTTTILASFDVVNLYSNIPHSYGIEAIQYWLEKYPQELPERTHKNFIIKGIKFILENIYFVFNNEIYRQIKRTAMGTKVTPTYANLVMGYFEMTLYKKIGENFGIWKRYLDDSLILWSESEEDIEKFKDIINNIHCDIQFTSESSNKEIPFLDRMWGGLRMIPLSEHLSKCAKSSSKKFSVFPFYKFPEEAKEQQRIIIIKEAEFISKYKPKLNK